MSYRPIWPRNRAWPAYPVMRPGWGGDFAASSPEPQRSMLEAAGADRFGASRSDTHEGKGQWAN
jgi:hypothetical protein